jgi:hypothetical protein
MNAKFLTQAVYALFGVGYLAAGMSLMLFKSGGLPPSVSYVIGQLTEQNGDVLHVAQEWGTHMIILGLVTLWFIRHYEISGLFHWAMTIGWAFFVYIHWHDVRGGTAPLKALLLDAIPFALFFVTGVMRRK